MEFRSRRLFRRWHFAALAIALLLGIPALILLILLHATLPPKHQRLAIEGLSAPVAISFDQDGVPRIAANTDLDAAAALGFVHARDRMFQMELMRHAGSGRLSELVGASGLRTDLLMRTLGLRLSADSDLPRLPPHTRALLQAYSLGVNAWINARGRFASPESVLFGKPEPWTPVDSLLWGKIMSLYLSGNYRTELARLALSRRIRPSDIPSLWPSLQQPPAPQAAASTADTQFAALLEDFLPRFPDPFTLPPTASNEWAVDGTHTATGAPLLAGDPHLGYSLPAIWYLARLDTPTNTLAGATAPGVPFVVVGRNAHIAWTLTTAGTDTQDIFVETPVDQTHYLTPDGPAVYLTRTETIHVLGGADHVITVRTTRHGPVISDVDPQAQTGMVLALSMASLAGTDTAPAGLDTIDTAPDAATALRAAALVTSTNQNLLVADAHTIGFAMTGRVPIRRAGDGDVPVDGGSGNFDWVGYASGAQLPHLTAPASGRLVNANERDAPADFPVFLGQDWFGDWRARRIRTLLDSLPHATPDDFVRMQNDTTSTYAQQLLPVLRQIPPLSPLAARALALLTNWNGAMDRDMPQPLIFNAWIQHLGLALLDHAGVPVSLSGPRMEFVASVLTGDNTRWCDTSCTPLIQAALDQTVADLAQVQGQNPDDWAWGKAHHAVFAHAVLGQIPVLGWLTTRRIAASGDDNTLDRGAMAELAVPNFDDVHGGAYRGVYDLADLDRSRFILTPGESGNLFSAHAADFMQRWRDGKTILLGKTPTHISATLDLQPQAATSGARP